MEQSTQTTQGAGQSDDTQSFIQHETEVLHKEIVHEQHILEALEALKDNPRLQEEVAKLSHQLTELQALLKATQEKDAAAKERAVKDAILLTHEEDERKLTKAVQDAHAEDQALMTKELLHAHEEAVEHVHEEDKRIMSQAMHDASIDVMHTIEELHDLVEHFSALVQSSGKSMFGYSKVKKEALDQFVEELSKKVSALKPALDAAAKHAAEKVVTTVPEPIVSPKELMPAAKI